ncbi:MAG: hypothetical protein HY882_00465, partial [Deltaproteobacteria bacterium]|nr:hypothetical protein [Deltaproteobacteria bacterium]
MAANHSFQFNAFLRALFLIFSAAVFTVILGFLAFTSCLFDRSGRWPSVFQRAWGKWLLRTNGIHVNAVGLEHLGKDRAYILISNHASILDIPGIIAAIPLP